MTRDEIVTKLGEHGEAFSRRDPDALAATHTPEGTFESPAHGVLKGRPAILEMYKYWFGAFPDLQLTWADPIIDGNRAAVFWVFAGTSDGPFFGALGAGSKVDMHGAAEFVFGDDGIVSVRHIFDFSSVLVKTGVLKVKPAT